jgi:hypothetical protein
MALVLLNPGIEPLGQFTGLSTLISSVKGGEVLTFGAASTVQGGAADDADGYLATGYRPILVLAGATAAPSGPPYMLCDDGLLHYGTLFGSVVGGTVGQQVNGPNSFTGAILGPSTALGSGKLTAWDKPGLYGVTLDAVDATVTTGLQPSNSSLTPGAAVYVTVQANASTNGGTQGQLTGNSHSGNVQVGFFVEFRTNGSLVTTPNRLVSALNSPSTVVGGVLPNSLYMAVISFSPTAGF